MFGPHIMLDLQQCNYDKINSQEYVYRLLYDLPDLIGMTKITTPYVFPYCGVNPKDKGITGIVIIAESHLTIHTFTEKDYVFCDVFSCKPFDEEFAIEYLTNAFDSKKYDLHREYRGADFDNE